MIKIKIYKCKIFIFIVKFSEYSQHLGKHNRYIYYKFLIMSRFFYMIYFFYIFDYLYFVDKNLLD